MSVRLDSGREFTIGVGITTFERFDRFKECFENLLKDCRDVDEIMVVDDASEKDRERYDAYFDNIKFKHIKIVVHKKNKGVGVGKNEIMRYFYENDFDYFFTLEDDINIKSPEVFKVYVEAALKSGYEHLNFAKHGTLNTTYYTREVNGFKMKFYPHIVGAFSLYSRKLIKEIGYNDERFKNAMEHVEFTYRASLKGLTSKFWHFADVMENTDLLEEQVDALKDSSIRPRDDWAVNVENAWFLFKEKHGVFVRDIQK